jgi:hypothetical protein
MPQMQRHQTAPTGIKNAFNSSAAAPANQYGLRSFSNNSELEKQSCVRPQDVLPYRTIYFHWYDVQAKLLFVQYSLDSSKVFVFGLLRKIDLLASGPGSSSTSFTLVSIFTLVNSLRRSSLQALMDQIIVSTTIKRLGWWSSSLCSVTIALDPHSSVLLEWNQASQNGPTKFLARTEANQPTVV